MEDCEDRIVVVHVHVAGYSCQLENRDTIADLDTAHRARVRDDRNQLSGPHGKPYRAREDHAKSKRHHAELAGACSPEQRDCISPVGLSRPFRHNTHVVNVARSGGFARR